MICGVFMGTDAQMTRRAVQNANGVRIVVLRGRRMASRGESWMLLKLVGNENGEPHGPETKISGSHVKGQFAVEQKAVGLN